MLMIEQTRDAAEIEFQTYHGSDIAERLLRYNVLAKNVELATKEAP